MGRLEEAFRRQILPKDMYDDDRINEASSLGESAGPSRKHSDEDKEKDKGKGILSMFSLGKQRDLKQIEEENLKKLRISKIEELPIMENMSDHTSSHITGPLESHATLTDSRIMDNMGAPVSVERTTSNFIRGSSDSG